MILSRKLSDALNEQINMEMWSSNLYLSMSVHFTQIGLDGFAHWTLKQSQEELEHAYINDRLLNQAWRTSDDRSS